MQPQALSWLIGFKTMFAINNNPLPFLKQKRHKLELQPPPSIENVLNLPLNDKNLASKYWCLQAWMSIFIPQKNDMNKFISPPLLSIGEV